MNENEEIKVIVTIQELQLIGNALAELPYKVSKPVLDKINAQFNEFMVSKQEPKQ